MNDYELALFVLSTSPNRRTTKRVPPYRWVNMWLTIDGYAVWNLELSKLSNDVEALMLTGAYTKEDKYIPQLDQEMLHDGWEDVSMQISPSYRQQMKEACIQLVTLYKLHRKTGIESPLTINELMS